MNPRDRQSRCSSQLVEILVIDVATLAIWHISNAKIRHKKGVSRQYLDGETYYTAFLQSAIWITILFLSCSNFNLANRNSKGSGDSVESHVVSVDEHWQGLVVDKSSRQQVHGPVPCQ